jgi:MFS family permease
VIGYLSSLFWVYSPDGEERRIYPGWWEILAGAAHSFFGYGLYIYAWSAIQATMAKQFGWTATQLGVMGTITKEEGTIEGPLVGWAVDRFGPKWTAGLGWLIAGIGFLLLPFTSFFGGSVLWLYFAYGMLISIGMNSGLYTTSQKAVNRWFIRNRGLAIGLVTTGAGYGSPILIPAIAFLIVKYGWETATVVSGLCFIFMGVVVGFALFRRYGPEQSGFLPDNDKSIPLSAPAPVRTEGSAVPDAAGAPVARLKEFGVREALRTRSFWIYSLGGLVIGWGGVNLPLFQSLRMQEAGYTLQTAALWYALDFVFTTVGRTGEAIIGDLVHPRIGTAVANILQGIGFYCFAVAGNDWWLWGYVVFHGIGYGYSIPAAPVLVGALFGREWYGTIRGINTAINAVLSLPGPILFGFLRDWSGNYYVPFAYGALMYIIGGAVYFFATTPKGQIEPGRRSPSGVH